MTTKDAALRLALEALEESRDDVATCLSDCRALAGIAFYEQQLIKHDAAIEGLKQALAQQEPPNPWAEAVIEQLVIHHIYRKEHDADPRKAIRDLFCISNAMVLEPLVSKPAQDLVDRGRKESQPAQEPVMYQYRWLNPGDKPDQPESELEWKLVEVRNVYTDTIANRIDELRGYRFNGKPVYEVRPLYAAPPTQSAIKEVVVNADYREMWMHTVKLNQQLCEKLVAPTTQPALSDERLAEIAKPFISSMGDHWCHEDGIRDNGTIEEFARAVIEAHCRGGADK